MTTSAATVIPTVHIVDDDASFRTAITRLLKAVGYIVRAYSSGAEFVQSSVGGGPGCVLLDMFMPDGTGLEVQRTLAHRTDRLPLIFVSGQAAIPDSVRAMQAGAVDFLTKPINKEALFGAIGLAVASYHETRSLREKDHDTERCYKTLTPRQREVFQGVVAGKLNKQISADLGIAERTIKAHRAEVMKKMAVNSVADLVRLAICLQNSSHSRTTQV